MRALKSKLRRGTQNGALEARYTNLIVQLKDLENVNKIHTHFIDWLRSNWSSIRLPTLFSEIFDIPISSKSSSSSAISESIGDSLANDSDESAAEEFNRTERDGKQASVVAGENVGNKLMGEFGNKSSGEVEAGFMPTIQATEGMIHHEVSYNHDEDFFFSLARFQDTDDKIEATDLNPTVDCLDAAGH